MSTNQWWKLQGIFCVYKPNNISFHHLRQIIVANLTKDLNESWRPVEENYVSIQGSLSPQTPELTVNVKNKLSVHPLALGEVYKMDNIRVHFANVLKYNTSGVCVGGIGKGSKFAHKLMNSNIIKTYQLNGVLGKATDNQYISGKVVEKSSFKHVRVGNIDQMLLVTQASHQRKAMEFLGLDIQSQVCSFLLIYRSSLQNWFQGGGGSCKSNRTQEAYEVLSKDGLVRPADKKVPLVYSLKCVDFKPPHFTIELNCINEDEMYLLTIIHTLGLMLKTNATTTKIRCIRYGPYNVDHALLHKHWRLPYIIENIEHLKPINKLAHIDSPYLNSEKIDNDFKNEDSTIDNLM